MNRLRFIIYTLLFLAFGTAGAQDTLIVTNSVTSLEQRIAYDDIILVQPRSSDDRATIIYGSNYGAITTLEVYDDVLEYQRCRLLDFTNKVSGRRTAVPFSSIDTVTSSGNQGGATISVINSRLNYSSSYTTAEKFNQVFVAWADCENSARRPVYEVQNVGYGAAVGKKVVDGKLQLKTLQGTGGIQVRERAGVLEIDGNGVGGGGGGGSGSTDLSSTQGTSSVIIESSTGNPTTIFQATPTRSGVITAADQEKLNGIAPGAQPPQSGAEIVSNINTQLGNTTWQSGGGDADLGYIPGPATGRVTNTVGDPADILAVDDTNAGLMLPEDKTKLDGIAPGAQPDQTGAEIVSSINTQLGNSTWQQGGSSGGAGPTDLTYTASSTEGVINSSTGNNAIIPAANASNAGLFLPAEKTKLAGLVSESNLSYQASVTAGTVSNDNGTGFVIPTATTANAGLMKPTDRGKLDGIENNATADQTPAELVQGINDALGNDDWQTAGGGLNLFFDSPTPIGDASIKVVRLGAGPTTFSGNATSGYEIGINGNVEVTQLDFVGSNSTANSNGELVLKIDNSPTGPDRFWMIDIYDLNSNQQLDVFAFGLVPRTTVSNAITTITIPNIAGNFPSGFRLIMR